MILGTLFRQKRIGVYQSKTLVSASNTVSALTWTRESVNSWKSCLFPLENASAMISPV